MLHRKLVALIASAPRTDEAPSFHNSSPGRREGILRAFHDGRTYLINLKELSPEEEAEILTDNHPLSVLYMSDSGLPGGLPFVGVLDSVHRGGVNPLRLEVQIDFNPGHSPRQFTRDGEILAAASTGEITLTSTGEVYRCAVVGAK